MEGGGSEVARRFDFWDQLSNEFDLGMVRDFPNTMGQCVPAREEWDWGVVGEENSGSGVCQKRDWINFLSLTATCSALVVY